MQVYCRLCYAKKFGHRMKSDYKGWMDVKAIQGTPGEKTCCPRCSGKVRNEAQSIKRKQRWY